MTTSSFTEHRNSREEIPYDSIANLATLRPRAVCTEGCEICKLCSTIDVGAGHFCKGCNHNLSTCYAADLDDRAYFQSTPAPFRHRWNRACDSAAYWMVMNALAGATVLLPIIS
ncbi:hypothetical protein [Variovorax sp. KK3]|uniref:hypothetical protein n=1 Tax=Variovorax sp. KK3 TaxID=1855728 RepID=UPI00097BAA74|nr:hypothetical protein [Variovorax sp. KK3]